MRYYSRYQGYGFLGGDYPAVKLLLIANFGAYLLQFVVGALFGEAIIYQHLALSSQVWKGEIWQLATYMFLHGDMWHILFNMLALWMFGRELEMAWGSREFVKYYFICGIGAGLTFLFFSKGVVIGASGAVFGILLAFGMTFPDQIILMSLLFPIKAKYMVLIYGVITFMNIARPGNDGIAHFAHLGGMVFGYLYLKKETLLFKLRRLQMPARPSVENRAPRPKPSESKNRIDEILDKINEIGYDRLTQEEKDILLNASQGSSGKEKGPS
ncbi:MAG: rhomboid family intramembrane serine protease [Bacteroidetes bacterium]|nr:rhomboid family intramembrane serine protease [Bacteroidota bacterium]